MFERWMGKALDRFLSQYFELNDDDAKAAKKKKSSPMGRSPGCSTSIYSAVWSGYISLHDLNVRVQLLNSYLQSIQVPISVVTFHIRTIEITIPKYNPLASPTFEQHDTAIFVMDGVHVLIRIHPHATSSDTEERHAVRDRAIHRRRRALERLVDPSASKTTWKDWIKQQFFQPQGYFQSLWTHLFDSLQIHIRDVHVRLEQDQSTSADAFALGILLESMHIQHDMEAAKSQEDPNTIFKVAELNRFGIYWNALHTDASLHKNDRVEQKMLTTSKLTPAEMVRALDQMICRRSATLLSSSSFFYVPQHTYILQPVDGQWHATIQTVWAGAAASESAMAPHIVVLCLVDDVSVQLRDFQFVQCLQLVHAIKEYKYNQRHWRYRPTNTIVVDPKAWWLYAVAAIRREFSERPQHRTSMRWSWKRWSVRQRYCLLYERFLRSSPVVDSAEDSITPSERNELTDMEDGVMGDLSVQDILVYRFVVQKRVGVKAAIDEVNTIRSSWLRRKVQSWVGEEVDDDEYNRLLLYWQELTSNDSINVVGETVDGTPTLTSAISLAWRVTQGQLTLFAPIGSTIDQPPVRRIQEKFLDFTFHGLSTTCSLLNDYDSMVLESSLQDVEVVELRSSQQKHVVISYESVEDQVDPLWTTSFKKNSPSRNECKYGIQCQLRTLQVDLVPDNEWMKKLKLLLQPLPSLRKAAKFWTELNLAMINSWASRRLGLMAKAETALSDHSTMDIDVVLDCPIFRISMDVTHVMVVDLGRASILTQKISGFAKEGIFRDVEPVRASASRESSRDDGRSERDLWKTPTRDGGGLENRENGTGFKSDLSIQLNSVNSATLGQKFKVGSHSVLGNGLLGDNVFINNTSCRVPLDYKMDSLFYDTYKVVFHVHGIRIESSTSNKSHLLHEMLVQCSFHKSVIPADHTLCRYKASVMIETLSLTLSHANILLLGSAWSRWMSAASFVDIGPGFDDGITEKSHYLDLLNGGSNFPTEGEFGLFNEAEFFDAAEQTSFMSDDDVFMDEDGVTDSEVESTGPSKKSSTGMKRHRRRPSSSSDVSSISEGSRVKRRLTFHDGGEHLTAENLARLEEEEDRDDSVVSAADSFRSAISLNYLVQLANDLQQEIVDVKARIADSKSQLANFRLLKSGGEAHDSILNSEYYNTRDWLRLASERATVELNALEASRSEIVAQINDIKSNNDRDVGNVIDQENVLFSAHKGTSLLKGVKRRNVKDAVIEHNLTVNLSRELFQFSVSFQSIVLCLLGFSNNIGDSLSESHGICSSTVNMSQVALVVHQRVGETSLDASIDSVALFTQDDSMTGLCLNHLVFGGIQNAPPEDTFAASLSDFDFVSSDEKFVSFSGILRTGITKTTQKHFKVVTIRLNFGDIKVTPKDTAILMLLEVVAALREDLRTFVLPKSDDESVVHTDPAESVSVNFDVAVVFYSLRCLLFDSQGIAAALLVTDLRFRFMGSRSNRLLKDRIRLDCGCSNTRAVSFSNTGLAEEVFGKGDAYHPMLFRFRVKLQKVPMEFVKGWVLEDRNVTDSTRFIDDAQISLLKQAVWNCHIGVKVDQIRAIAHPNSIRRINDGFVNLRRCFSHNTTKPASKSSTIGISGLPVRWRIDFSLREISVGLHRRAVDIDECSPESFDVSFSMIFSVELSSTLPEGVIVRCSMTQFCVVQSLNQWIVLKPSSCKGEVEFALRGRFCTDLKVKQLEIPDGFSWVQDQPIMQLQDSCASTMDSGRLAVSVIELCLPVSVCVSITATVTSLLAAISNPSKNVKVDEPRTSSDESLSRGKSISVCIASILVVLYRPKVTESTVNRVKNVAALSLDKINISCSKSEEMKELQLDIEKISVIDYTCTDGVQSISVDSIKSDDKVSALNLSVFLTSYSDRYHAAVDIVIGETQCLILPSLVKSVLWFYKEMKSTHDLLEKPPIIQTNDKIDKQQYTLITRITKLRVRLRIEAIEVILSSKDIPRHIDNNLTDAIGVVACRLRIDAYGSYRVLLGNKDVYVSSTTILSSHFLDESIEQALLDLQPREEARTVLISDVDIAVDNLQVLRTAISRADGLIPKFAVSPPIAGEQRITNTFCFKVRQQAAFVIVSPESPILPGSGICIAHTINLNSDFVDVLVYISSSTGGMSDAIRVSIRPILDLFKKEPPEDFNTTVKPKGKLDCILEAAATISVRVEGFMFTFVPGGATQLTESPIVKFELSRFAMGCALIPVKIDSLTVPETSPESLSSKPAISLHNLTLGGWILCEVSASYHNRRLVAWEPFVEPWELEIRVGLDFVRANCIGPILGYEALRDSPHFDVESSLTPFANGSHRLKTLGNFFRFPFSNDTLERKVGADTIPSFLETEIDLSFLILANTARNMISTAMPPSLRPAIEDSNGSALCSFPGSMPLTWLHQFGFPVMKDVESNSSSQPSALFCWISDCSPLNMNLTGALIETLSEYSGDNTRSLAPHWIRNDSGLDIRFLEVLDTGRGALNDKNRKVVVQNGSQVPLALRRSMSQSCDPHRAYILLELGNYEETVGRVELPGLRQSGRSNALLFSYRITTKISVDTVGIHRYPIEWNVDRRSYVQGAPHSLGWVIVRVALNDGVKIVTIESPLMLKSELENDVLCEVRDHGGLSLLWRCLVKKSEDQSSVSYYPIPPDIVPSLHHKSNFLGIAALPKSVSFQHETDVPQITLNRLTRISPPMPYSPSSIGKGLIDESQICIQILDPRFGNSALASQSNTLYVDVCSLRIGSFSLDHSRDQPSKETSFIPEQRLVVLRSCIAIRNFLAFPIEVQVKTRESTSLPSHSGKQITHNDKDDWMNLGDLDCSCDCRWSDAKPSDSIDVRIRMVANNDGISCQFPIWSIPVTISPANLRESGLQDNPLKLKLHDSSDVPLVLCVVVNSDDSFQEQASSSECVRKFSTKLSTALRVVSIYSPFWIINGTGLDLQFKSRDFIAGQVDVGFLAGNSKGREESYHQETLGMGELLDDIDLSYLQSKDSLQILMVGDEASTMLHIRRRSSRLLMSEGRVSSWSDPVILSGDTRRFQDFIVYPPPKHSKFTRTQASGENIGVPFLLRCRIIPAPIQFGGTYGTKLVHVVCRYVVINELGYEIEISSGGTHHNHVSVAADGFPHTFHFEDSLPIRVRPKEFGWLWSGKFNVRNSRRELTFCLKHSIKKHIILVTVECHTKHPAGTCIVVFRNESQAPYRIENHTMYPIKYYQVQTFTDSLFSKVDAQSSNNIILPFHNAEFAWEEPEYGRRLIRLELAEFGDLLQNISRCTLGTFSVDSIVPGSEIALPVPNLSCKIIADGPCRVLRISQSSVSGIPQANLGFQSVKSPSAALTLTITARLVHGFGVSVVDWQPQELIYVRFNDIQFEANTNTEKETLKISVESVVVDNQLWVTPYPILLRIGNTSRRRKSSRQAALSVLLNRVYTKQSIAGHFTQIENCTLTSLPTILCIDGILAAHALRMASNVRQILSKDACITLTRNQRLSKALEIGSTEHNVDEIQLFGALSKEMAAQDLYHAIDYGMATIAIASKLKLLYRPPDSVAASKKSYPSIDSTIFGLLSTHRHKIYIERLRVSTTAAEISWSGVLPIASSLPRLLRPALTFEGLPLMLRAYSSSHAFGSLEEHILSIKSHYISIWRVVDLIAGVMMKPSFLVRACLFTTRESCSLFLSSAANCLSSTEKYLKTFDPKAWSENPSFSLNLSLGKKVLRSFLFGSTSVLHGFSKLTATTAILLQYEASRQRTSGGLVRGRNPRLFAHVDGNKLLVQYVEGENAGKAILSRVGSGEFLGEGYVYHVEGVRLPKNVSKLESGMDATPLILMLTLDRMLLLHGKLDNEFCNIVWESPYGNIVFVEFCTEQRSDEFASILVWYLKDSAGSLEERFAKSLSNETGGLETLQCKPVFVPMTFMKALRSRLLLVTSVGQIFGSQTSTNT